jgi:hypothetical protein
MSFEREIYNSMMLASEEKDVFATQHQKTTGQSGSILAGCGIVLGIRNG